MLLPWRTALEMFNFSLLEVARRGSAAEPRERGLELLELVGLGGFADARPAKLSGGMQRRGSVRTPMQDWSACGRSSRLDHRSRTPVHRGRSDSSSRRSFRSLITGCCFSTNFRNFHATCWT